MTRPPVLRASFEIQSDELVVDNFAGGGGASTGIRAGLTRPVDIAINHDAAAIAMHEANHPETRHYRENILEIDPAEVCSGRRVGLVWFSPDCTHFSKAKGTKPLSKEIRGLAWVVVNWAKTVRPRVMFLENVEEFQTWGPLDDEGQPIKARAGETFRQWLSELVDLGYDVEYRTLVAADFGAPTIRKRLFLVARCDGLPIVWPEGTHGVGRAHAWRAAAEVIDWSIPCPSIFGRRRPLAEATLKRIAMGLRKYVINSAQPFILPVTHQGDSRVHGIDEPMRTVTAAHRGELAMATPFIAPVKSWGGGGNTARSLEEPMRTITASKRGEFALTTPFVVRHGHYSTKTGAGLREGCGAGTFRGQKLEDPLATICGTEDKHIVCPLITKCFGGPNGHLTPGHDIRSPLSTVTIKDHHRLTAAFLTKYYGSATSGASVERPMPTITAGGKRGGGHIAKVRALLKKYDGGPKTLPLFDALAGLDPKERRGLVVVGGETYQIVDIGMRMLATRELFGAQGFPGAYIIDPLLYGKPLNKTQQTALAGNSVCPDVAEAIVAANTRERGRRAA